MNRLNFTCALSTLALAASLAACAHTPPTQTKAPPETATRSLAAGLAVNASGDEPSLRNDLLHQISDLQPVSFAYDSDNLGPDARATLTSNAAWLKAHPEVRVQAAGNCDERGTVEYNLALGQRRATAVRKYYRMLGIKGSRVATISYGKERPVCKDSNEACWSRNRRAETLGAFPADVSRKP